MSPIDRVSLCLRRLAWHCASPGVIDQRPDEVLLEGLDACDEVRALLREADATESALSRMSVELEEARRDLLHAQATARLLSDSLTRAQASVQMLDRQQMAALAELEELRR
jgi:hypothetical protein